QGFVRSQVLLALVETGSLRALLDGARTPDDLARMAEIPARRMTALLQGGAALGLLARRRDGCFALARRGAVILGVPGLEAMIRHNRALYADMADPVALLRGEGETELARFWPYVFGRAGEVAPEVAERYSDLMAQSQRLVAEDVLRAAPLSGARVLMDVGGGTGAFVAAALNAHPALKAMLVDLPEVVDAARARLGAAGVATRVTLCPMSFREADLPEGADTISLVRVLYDHADATVRTLLSNVYRALPPGGRLIVAEPMAGGAQPEAAGDLYFAFYTLAMGAGRARSAAEIGALCGEAGFVVRHSPRPARPYVTSVLVCEKP
ncbi:MAG: methyltransferase domain-containing protein, partial [Roseovarius sp.]|nr:methyltransferase domain-containing protein [Roseovarius sp.]